MVLTAALSVMLKPTHRLSADSPAIVLADVIPVSFGDWRELPQGPQNIVNPQEKQALDDIYSQTLSRTYVNSAGYRIMLSVA
jgi:hypothetical protein